MTRCCKATAVRNRHIHTHCASFIIKLSSMHFGKLHCEHLDKNWHIENLKKWFGILRQDMKNAIVICHEC